VFTVSPLLFSQSALFISSYLWAALFFFFFFISGAGLQ
jgi:hypothetical protein